MKKNNLESVENLKFENLQINLETSNSQSLPQDYHDITTIFLREENEFYIPFFYEGDEKLSLLFFDSKYTGVLIDIKKDSISIEENRVTFDFAVIKNPKNLSVDEFKDAEFNMLVQSALNDLLNKIDKWEKSKEK